MSDPASTTQPIGWISVLPPIVMFVLGFFSAVFAEPIRQRIFRPILELNFTKDSDCITWTPSSTAMPHIRITTEAYYIRVKVNNRKPRVADKCRAYLVNVEEQDQNGIFKPSIYADSIQLAWSCQQKGEERRPIDLPNGVKQYVDIISTHSVDNSYRPEIAPFPYRYEAIFDKTPKVLRLTIQVSGDNVKPEFIKIVFDWKGNWDNFETYRA